jgi:toxin ParE1/3/4
MNIVWTRIAQRDMDDLVDYIAQNSPETALRVYNTIHQSIDRLAAFPYSGRVGRVASTRELVVPALPYIVVYDVVGDTVRILSVMHTSRKWLERFG